MDKLKPCPFCKDSWLFVSDGDYNSGYEKEGYRVNCFCGWAWQAIRWHKSKEDAINSWNRIVMNRLRKGKELCGKN